MRAGWNASVCDGWAIRQVDGWWLHAAMYEAGAAMGLSRARDGAWRSQGLMLMMMILRLPAAAELWSKGGGRHAGWPERICL